MIKRPPTLPKVCIFVWRLGRDCLSIESRVLVAGLGFRVCPFCSLVVETSLHAFRDCSDVIEALHLGGFPDSVITSRTTSIFDWLVTVTIATLLHEDFIAANDNLKMLAYLWTMPSSRIEALVSTWWLEIRVAGYWVDLHNTRMSLIRLF
ncbi:hypothetical protein GQ457_12G029460 [Hibiscus cannabinus]